MFDGWFLDDGVTNVTSTTLVTTSTAHTLTAKWIAIFHVVFHSDINPTTTVDYLDGQQITSLPSPTRSGFEFMGWFTQKVGGDKISVGWTVTSNLDLYEHWAEVVTVFFDGNGGTPEYSSKTVTNGKVFGSLPGATREGYSFLGWFSSESGGDEITPNTVVSSQVSFTVFAHWSILSFYISFDTQSGSPISPVSLEYGQQIPWDTYITEREGYVFAGWFVDGQKCTYETMPAKNLDLVAHWGKNITITLNPCGGSVSPSVIYRVSNSVYGELPVPEKNGFTFTGWFTSETGGTKLNSNTEVEEHITTLYSHWERGTYYINFDSQGGEQVSPMPFLFEANITGLPELIKKEFFAFKGWYLDNQLTQPFNLVTMPAKNVTVYAKWVDAFKITFNAMGGTTTLEYMFLATGMLFGSLPNASKEGHTFVGWFTAQTGGVQVKADSEFSSTQAITLFAHWNVNSYTIVFNSNGGTTLPSVELEYGASIVLPTSVQKEGFVFDGWYQDSLLTMLMNLTTMPSHDLTLHAKWIQAFKIVFNPSGGHTELPHIYLAPGMAYGFYGNLPVARKEGYTFKGWFTDSSGGTVVNENTMFSGDKDTTLYAHYTVNQYVISFNTNGGSALPSKVFNFGSVVDVPTNIEKKGFVFDGWYLDSGLIYPMNLTTMPAKDITLYAKWKDVEPERDALDYIDVIFGSVIGGLLGIGAVVYGVLAFCCPVCAKDAQCGKLNLFTKCGCGRKLLEKCAKDSGMDDYQLDDINRGAASNSTGNSGH